MAHYHQGRPEFFRYESTFTLQGQPLRFYLDTGKKDQVLGLYFDYEGPDYITSQLGKLAKQVEGRDLGDIPVAEDGESFPFAFYFYRKFIHNVRGTLIPYYIQKGRPAESLLCRCFGVYKEDIHELVGSGVEVESIRDLGDHLKAGIGCASCHDDLKNELRPLLSAEVTGNWQEKGPETTLPLWKKLDPQSLAREVHQILRRWTKDKGNGLELELMGTKPGSILLKIKGENKIDRDEVKKSLLLDIESELGPGLELILFT